MDSVFRRRYFLVGSTVATLAQAVWGVAAPENNLTTLTLVDGTKPSSELIALNRRGSIVGFGLNWLNLLTIAHLDREGYPLLERVSFRVNLVAAAGLWFANLYGLFIGGLPAAFDRTKMLYSFVAQSLSFVYGLVCATSEGF